MVLTAVALLGAILFVATAYHLFTAEAAVDPDNPTPSVLPDTPSDPIEPDTPDTPTEPPKKPVIIETNIPR